ncbi:50S ribosomal protein L13 [Candidatus Saccharibacteria bacterium]|jgi:large subunit ribosomal protein L13|nr:50S ribosomal protein L13 [Candidatus Saccharibacteria bacterium]MDQ5969559.1 large subunit ribosomal protein [Patescibacteria group bacterium]
MNTKTYSAKPTDVERRWIVIDASDAPLGRISTVIATYLTGKNKPSYTAHIDCGDNVIVTNAANLVVTGNKLLAKKYYRYSGFPGGMKETTLSAQLEKDPTVVIKAAVKGMLPKNKLANERMKRLSVFVDENHGHEAQKPMKVEVKNA